MDNTWVIMPFVDCCDMTMQAVEDCLAQSVPTRVLLVDQGSSQETVERVRAWVDERSLRPPPPYDRDPDYRLAGPPLVLCWFNQPALPSLSLTWNRALDFVWALGGTEALVVNDDVRLHPQTLEYLSKVASRERTWFVSAVGVHDEGFALHGPDYVYTDGDFWIPQEAQAHYGWQLLSIGGPDFSCFLLTQEGHQHYRFDESFIPAWHEDNDLHRRYMLGGHGDKIFGINLPFLHYGSQTLNQANPERQAKLRKAFEGSRARYEQKWGGRADHETFRTAFNQEGNPNVPLEAGTTNAELQAYWLARMRGEYAN